MMNRTLRFQEGVVVRVISKVSRNRGRIGTEVNHCKGNYPDIITVRFFDGETARFLRNQFKKGKEEMFKLSKEDKLFLISIGYVEEDFKQIEKAANKTKLKLMDESRPITRQEAIELLGRSNFLSGLARSAFHFSAHRQTEDGQCVSFDSSKFFVC